MALRIDDEYGADWREALPRLAGRVVAVREVVSADAATLFDQLTDSRVTQHIAPPPPSVSAFEAFIEWTHQQRRAGRSVCFGIVPHGLQRAVGIIQIRSFEPSFSVAEWGFALGASFWSTGVFPEAASLVARFAFAQLGCYRLEGRVVSQNGRGNSALEKIGGSAEAILSRAFKRNEHYDEQLLWSLIAGEWHAPAPTHRQRFLEATTKTKITRAVADVTERLRVARPENTPRQPTQFPYFVTAHSLRSICPLCGGRLMGAPECPRCRR
jgi:RimJ/RimL family protein N-acetyltransferase